MAMLMIKNIYFVFNIFYVIKITLIKINLHSFFAVINTTRPNTTIGILDFFSQTTTITVSMSLRNVTIIKLVSKTLFILYFVGFQDIPREFNVSLLRGAPNPRAVFSSKVRNAAQKSI